MAWRSRATTNSALVADLVDANLLRSSAVIDAFKTVDRGWFLPSRFPDAYFDCPQPIGHHVTISAPHMHAQMAELLQVTRAQRANTSAIRALDIGSGSGFLTAVLGIMAVGTAALNNPGKIPSTAGYVLGIEHVPELVDSSKAIIAKHLPQLADVIEIRQGDGRKLDESQLGLFDIIHVGAACETFPDHLVKLLKPHGRLVVPVGSRLHGQELLVVDKDSNGKVSVKKDCDVIFVPLTSFEKQQRM
jgi:protein-L-isoaspartate(D-aspartate) O-methyltransferase